LCCFGYNFCSRAAIEKKLYSYEANQFFYLKKIQKIKTKIEPIGTYLKSHLSPEGTNSPLEVKSPPFACPFVIIFKMKVTNNISVL